VDAPNARRLAESISDDILAGRLTDGEKLPSERLLATSFGVGRPLVREALRSLEELGLVETRAGRGTFVRATTTGVHRQLGVAIRRRGATAAELSEARITLESQAAGLAATRATADDIDRLEEALRQLEASEGVEHVRNDLAFHLAIAAAAHNPVIEMMLESIAPLTVALMARSVGDPQVMAEEDGDDDERHHHGDLTPREVLDGLQRGIGDRAEDHPPVEPQRIAGRQDDAGGGEQGDPGVDLEGAEQCQELSDESGRARQADIGQREDHEHGGIEGHPIDEAAEDRNLVGVHAIVDDADAQEEPG
jgi:DNA-binding FadR family transcriptional regulator